MAAATQNTTHDVLIVGAGPTGLAMAYLLDRHGVTPRLIDAAAGPAPESRALAMHARTLEVLGEPLVSDLLAEGQELTRVELYGSDRAPLASVDLAGTPTRHAFALGLSQSVIERVMIERLQTRGIAVEWNTRLTGLSQRPDRVEVTLLRPDGDEERTEASWVIGCDGVRSATREAAGFSLEASRDARWWLLADARLEGEVPPKGAGRGFLSQNGIMALIPLEREGWWRVIAVGDEGEARPEVTDAVIAELLRERSAFDVRLEETCWLSAFRIREHVATSYRSNRVLIAGDAAHAHSPLGGQGMNTGVQDAANLAWKLALVLRGDASDALLDSYEAERLPVAQELVRRTGRGTRAMYASAPWLIWLRNTAIQVALQLDFVTDRVRRGVEMLTVAYPGSPLVGEGAPSAHRGHDAELPDAAARRALSQVASPGERAPLETEAIGAHLDSPRHTALLFDGRQATAAGYQRMRDAARDLAARWPDRFQLLHVTPTPEAASELAEAPGEVIVDADGSWHEAFGAETETLVVVRPDGYIGWRSQPIDLAAMSRWWDTITG